MGSSWGFALSMGFTDLAADISTESTGVMKTAIIWVAGVVIIGITALGWQATEGKIWAFAVGIAVLLLDVGLLLMIFEPMDALISIAFHAWAAWSLFTGIKALKSTPAQP